jgi:hypothetical protein
MIFHPLGIFRSVKRSDMRTPEPVKLPDQPATSRRTTAMDSRMSTLTTRGSILGAGPFLSIQSKRNWIPMASLVPGVAEERSVRMKGGTHKLALALFASVNVHLHGLDDSVVFGEVFALGHAETVGPESAGRQRPNAAKVGRELNRPWGISAIRSPLSSNRLRDAEQS